MAQDNSSMEFLKTLCDSFGPSGFEMEPARITKNYVAPYADELSSDKLGSLVFRKKGVKDAPVVLVAGHIDEVGFIITSVNKLGFLTFSTVGGWFDQVLLGQRVIVRTNKGDLFGVIAAKPPHLLTAEERSKVIVKERMFIDIGASNEKEAEKMGVRVGDPAIPDSRFSIMEKTVIKDKKEKGKTKLVIGKAFDDRMGVYIAAEVLRELVTKKIRHPNTFVGAATTMEEVGLRGARTTAYMIKPDVAIALDVDIAGDVPGIEPHEAPTKLGDGPTLCTFDLSMIPNQPLKELVIKIAKQKRIPLQLSLAKGGTDAGMIHMTHAGCPCVVIGVPTRHIHSHVGIVSMNDVYNCIKLIVELTKVLDEKTVKSFTEI